MMGEEEEVEISAALLERLRDAKRVTVLTGAGVSAESGIPTFRGAGGIWEKYDFQKLATPWGFKEDPELVWEWYKLRQVEMKKAVPNPAHIVIASMAKYYQAFRVLTQNIDGMHQRAGSVDVVELHGSIWRMRCERDRTTITLDAPVTEIPPLCQCGSIMRPDVVWFGEPLKPEILSVPLHDGLLLRGGALLAGFRCTFLVLLASLGLGLLLIRQTATSEIGCNPPSQSNGSLEGILPHTLRYIKLL